MFSFTLLDDFKASAAEPTSRLYTDLHQIISCHNSLQFELMIHQMQAALQQGWYAVAVLTYELGAQLQQVNLTEAEPVPPSHVLIYRSCQRLSQTEVTQWLEEQCGVDTQSTDVAGIANLHASVDEEEFIRHIERIQRYIADGDTYQVNYTFRLHFQAYGSLFLLYQRLRERQSVPFGALISMPDGSAILSLSPELFIRHSQGHLFSAPMKGTAAALVTHDEHASDQVNLQRCKQLSLDGKTRAENVMIVDLLRNDLGRIAQPGSVRVPHLFQVQRFNSVLQMTSSVSAFCRDDLQLVDLLKAIYPCGSITGAPKIRTMQIINELETEARGVYTGAIGWFDPNISAGIPDFCLSVPIRTLHIQAASADGLRRGVMGVGAGIVFESEARNEYKECQLKAQFLTELPAQFSLFETMYATKEDGCRYWNRHLSRLKESARYFGVPLNSLEIERQLAITCAKFQGHTPYRLKLSADGTGQIQIDYAVLPLIKTPVNFMLATTLQQSQSIWLQHKTSLRTVYDEAWKTAEQHGAFDMVFCNEHGELTEGGRSNLLVKIAERWYTPPLSAGVLPGVMRAVLMDDPEWKVTERIITVDELMNAQELAMCNALRAVLPANLINR